MLDIPIAQHTFLHSRATELATKIHWQHDERRLSNTATIIGRDTRFHAMTIAEIVQMLGRPLASMEALCRPLSLDIT